MPQDIRELGRRVKAKYPGKYDDMADDEVGRRVKRKYPGAYDDFTDTPAAEAPGFIGNVAIGAERGYRKYLEPALSSIGEVTEGMKVGDFAPALQMAKEAARGTYRALTVPAPQFARDPQTGAQTMTGIRPPDPALQAAQAERQARYQASPEGRRSAERLAALDVRAGLDPSITGKVTRGTTELLTGAAPSLATAIATRGAVLPTAVAAAAQSANQPSMIGPSAAIGALPVPVGQAFRAGVNTIRRTFGKGAAQIVEAEALPVATARVRESIGEAVPAPAAPPSATSLQSAFAKLGTENVDEIAEMIANANRRLNETRTVLGGKKQPITKAERLNSWEDYNRLKQITADEHRALSEVLPARTFSPVVHGYRGGGEPSRAISDIPTGERSAQLDANLRELEAFFGGQSTAPRISAETAIPAPQIAERMAGMARTPTSPVSLPTLRAEFPGMSKQQFDDEVLKLAEQGQVAIHRHDAPGLLTEAEREGLVKVGDDYFTAATVRGPSVSAPLDMAVSEAAATVPRSGLQKAKDELLGTLGAFKSLRSTADISYPLRQGALLLLRPFQWRQAGKVWKEMFRGFRTKNFDAIKDAIDTHPLAGRMDGAGLYRGTKAAGEEAFGQRAGSKVSEIVRKAPIVKQSEQAYTAAADTQRVQAFEQYARLIDKAGLSPEDALKADKAAAEWINIATGRGSLGKRLDKAFEALNLAFFSPRYVASRLNVFNPAMYIRNASSPGGRVVLKQQMSDLMQFASVVATTMYLAKQAGADVGLNPNSPDFLKIRVGNWRYDTLAGLQQVMRLIYRVGADIGRAGRGEKPKPGQTATDIAETFLSYKLSPPAGVFRDFINQRTVDKKPFTAGRAIADLTAPMQWADFVEAYQKEGWGGVFKATPGFTGVGAQLYNQTPVDAAIERSRPLFTELQRLNKRVSELRRKDGEKDDAFNARVQQFSQNYTRFGQQLLNSPRFQSAPDVIKDIALDRLDQRAKAITHREFAFPEIELDPNIIMDAAEQSKKNAVQK